MIDKGYRIALHCDDPGVGGTACSHFVWADLPAMAARLGRDHGALHADLVPKLRCAKCGSKAVSIRIHPPTAPSNIEVVWNGKRRS